MFKRGGKILLVETEVCASDAQHIYRVKWSILQGKKTLVYWLTHVNTSFVTAQLMIMDMIIFIQGW